jgi:hypothetical protein
MCVYIYNYIYIQFDWLILVEWPDRVNMSFRTGKKNIFFFHILNPPWLLYSGNQIEKKQKKNTKQLGMMPFACWKS